MCCAGEESLDIDSRMLLRFAHTQASLLDMYATLHRLSSLDARSPSDTSHSEVSIMGLDQEANIDLRISRQKLVEPEI